MSIAFLDVIKIYLSFLKICFIDTKTLDVDPKSTPPDLNGILRLIKTFWKLKVGRFKPPTCFLIEQGSFRPGQDIAL